MGPGGIEPPSVGLEPTGLPLAYGPYVINKRKLPLKDFVYH